MIYIRNQDKDKIFNFDNFQEVGYRKIENNSKHYIYLFNDGSLDIIGYYKSKERCLQILEEIEIICKNYLYCSGQSGFLQNSNSYPPTAVVVPQFYQMPEK